MDPASTYRKVHTCIWADRRFRELSAPPPSGRMLWFYLLTGEHLDVLPGLARAGEAQLAEALGWSVEAFRGCWQEIESRGMAAADWAARVVWLPNGVRYNGPANPNQVKAWQRAWAAIPECRLKDQAREALRRYMGERGEGFLQAFDAACPPCRAEPSPLRFRERYGERKGEPPAGGLANQEQEQDQEQEVAAARAHARAEAPALHADPTPEAAPRRKPYPIADRTELGPLGSEWRGRLERELGKGLAVAAAAEVDSVRAELEQLLERPHHGGVERALAWTVTTLAARRRSKAPEPGSVRYLVPLLREMPPIEVGAFDRARRECPEWAAVLDAAMALPRGNAPTEHQLEDVLLRLRASFLRGELHLEAADENRRGLVEAFWLEGLTRLAQETIGAHVLVHLTAAAPAAAREA